MSRFTEERVSNMSQQVFESADQLRCADPEHGLAKTGSASVASLA
jgi:hypothetical protein